MANLFRHANLNEFITKNRFELASWATGNVVCGIDEVGRGCLAGPVVTAAVILPIGKKSPLLKDSKVMTPQERLKAFAWIERHCWYGVGIVNNSLIDQHNIRGATFLAMKRALAHVLISCPQMPQAILVDAMPLELSDTDYKGIPVYYFPDAERKSSSIAAASIVAKVRRDALMEKLAAVFPGYHLEEHKGYATRLHQESLKNQKHSIIHRLSFLSKLINQTGEHEEQQTLC